MRASAHALHFRPRLWPSLATFVGLIVLLGLGTWQVERLHWKDALIAARAAQLAAPPESLPASAADWRAFDFRRVAVSGRWRDDLEQAFGVATYRNQLGHHLLTPLLRGDGTAVLVDRGWVPADWAHPAAKGEGHSEGEVRVTGIARYRADDRPGWFTPANEAVAGVWYWYDMAALEQALGLELLPVVVEADATPNPGGLPVGGLTRTGLPNNHLQYALTWYALALGLVAVYVAFSCRREAGRT